MGRVSFEQLLIRSLDRRLTGALVVTADTSLETVLELVDGVPSRVLVSDDYSRLGEILLERGLVTEEELTAALASSGVPVGEALVTAGAVDEAVIKRALVIQVVSRLVRLFGLPSSATWHFVPNDTRFLSLPQGEPVDPLRALAVGLEAHGPESRRVDAVIALLDDAPLVLSSGAHIERFGLHGEALTVVTHILAAQPTYEALLASEIGSPQVCRRVVYLLAAARFLAAGARGAAPSQPSSAASLPKLEAPLRGTPQTLSRLGLKRIAVSRAAPSEPGGSRADSELLGNMGAPEPRPSSPSVPLPGAAAPGMETGLSTEELHDRIAYHLAREEPGHALSLCELALERDRENLLVRALQVWGRVLLPRPDLKVLLFELDELLLIDPSFVVARHYRGMVRRRLGQDSAARQDFERVLSDDASHRGARAQLAEVSAPLSPTRR